MIAEIQPSAYQVPDNALWNIAGYVLTVLIAGFSGYKWGLKSQIYGKKLEIKTSMLPLIIGLLFDPAIKLKSLLTGCKRKRLINAWEAFSKTTTEELHTPQPGEEGEQTEKMRQTFLNRLNRLKSAVEDC